MKGHKNYLQSFDMLMNAIHDLAELQKAKTVLCDTPHGGVCLLVTMYADEWEYHFTVSNINGNRCMVKIELARDGPDTRRLIDHEFALLDYVLVDRAKVELTELEEHDKKTVVEKANGT